MLIFDASFRYDLQVRQISQEKENAMDVEGGGSCKRNTMSGTKRPSMDEDGIEAAKKLFRPSSGFGFNE